jgi:hypothetical protein
MGLAVDLALSTSEAIHSLRDLKPDLILRARFKTPIALLYEVASLGTVGHVSCPD